MKFTNKLNLPQGIVNACLREYDKGKADYSITQLLKPAQEHRLLQLNADKIIVDVADEIWKIFGSAVHAILEESNHFTDLKWHEDKLYKIEEALTMVEPEDLIEEIRRIIDLPKPQIGNLILEERMYARLGDVVISGQPDWYDMKRHVLEDYKVTSTYKITSKKFSDWIYQLNGYKWLLVQNERPVNTLKINAILKDWSHMKARMSKEEDGYPKSAVEVVEIPPMTILDTIQLYLDRVKLFRQSESIDTAKELAEQLPCSDEDRWKEPDTYAVVKEGNSRASRTFDNPQDANDWIDNASSKEEYKIEVRPGESKRCEYCLAKPFCAQYQKISENVILPKDGEPSARVKLPGDPAGEKVASKEALDLLNQFQQEAPKDAVSSSFKAMLEKANQKKRDQLREWEEREKAKEEEKKKEESSDDSKSDYEKSIERHRERIFNHLDKEKEESEPSNDAKPDDSVKKDNGINDLLEDLGL